MSEKESPRSSISTISGEFAAPDEEDVYGSSWDIRGWYMACPPLEAAYDATPAGYSEGSPSPRLSDNTCEPLRSIIEGRGRCGGINETAVEVSAGVIPGGIA